MGKTEERQNVKWGYNISKRIDLTGNRYGKLVVLEMVYNEKKKNFSHCKCKCDCGNIVIKDTYRLKTSKTVPSCGCSYKEIVRKRCDKNVVGKKFGRLTAIEAMWSDNEKDKVKCVCDCGKTVILSRGDVTTGHTLSCGCLQKQRVRECNFKDDSGYVSDFGVKIIKPYKRNDRNQLLWECECGLCKTHFYELPARVKNNHIRSCGCLVASSLEIYIARLLDENHITYDSQYTFDDLVTSKGYKLRFDFAILKDGEVFYLIEYDGAQHYTSISHFGGDKKLKLQQKYDKMKDNYCYNHNIPLLRIPYYLSTKQIKSQILNILNP